ncbi:MAG: prepilin-type N-terminal cleavage/methylation domain-containing protein [Candidatus Moranbacteria bacterium]|nr:prepilin-type N-terminal cleavage/methylation domain-containing protein [Candidatus Moranbacteria bacterium]
MMFSKTKKGVTMVEIMIVVAIISIVTTISISLLGNGRTLRELETNAREFAGVVREAQNYALTGKAVTGSGIPATAVPCFYVLSWSGSTYTLTHVYKNSVSVPCDIGGPSASVGVYTLKNGVTFNSASSFYFSLPHAKLSFNSGSVAAPLGKGGFSHTVCVYATDSASVLVNDYPSTAVCPVTP